MSVNRTKLIARLVLEQKGKLWWTFACFCRSTSCSLAINLVLFTLCVTSGTWISYTRDPVTAWFVRRCVVLLHSTMLFLSARQQKIYFVTNGQCQFFLITEAIWVKVVLATRNYLLSSSLDWWLDLNVGLLMPKNPDEVCVIKACRLQIMIFNMATKNCTGICELEIVTFHYHSLGYHVSQNRANLWLF